MSDNITPGLLIAIVAGIAVGALSAGVLSSLINSGLVLAAVSAALSVVATSLLRSGLLKTARQIGYGSTPIPGIVILFGIVSTIAGSLSGYYAATLVTSAPYAWQVGAGAGLFSSILMGLVGPDRFAPKYRKLTHPEQSSPATSRSEHTAARRGHHHPRDWSRKKLPSSSTLRHRCAGAPALLMMPWRCQSSS